jgi:type 1 glutamine amidotransferase
MCALSMRSSGPASIALLLFVAACGGSQQSPVGPSGPSGTESGRARVLMITTTAAFRHDSIPTAVASMRSLAASTNAFTVVATEDLSVLAEPTLASYDVVMFALTSGELALSPGQRTALVNFVAGGHGFIGVHSATDTLYEWPDYGRLVGAYFKEHPWTQRADVVVEDQGHPSTSGLGGRFSILEEFYTFRDNPRGRVQVLLRLDASSVGSVGDYPLAWAQSFGGGRAYYNALGHFSETWTDQRFLQQLAGAIRWAAGR